MRIMLLTILLAAAPLPAAAEALLRAPGGEEVVGWPAYDGAGKLTFVDCTGAMRTLAEGGSFGATEQRCPSEPAPFRATGTVRGVEPERSRLELQADGDAARMLYLSPAAAEELARLPPGQRVTVEGPVAGHARTVRPAS